MKSLFEKYIVGSYCLLAFLGITLFFDRSAINAFIEPKWALAGILVLLPMLLSFSFQNNKFSSSGGRIYPLVWAAFLGWTTLSLLWLPQWTMGLVSLSCWVVLAMSAYLGHIAGRSEDYKKVTICLALIAAVQIVVGLWQAVAYSKDLPRALIGTIGYHNFYAEFLILTCPFLGMIAINTRNRPTKAVLIMVLFVGLLVFIASQSRAGIIGILLMSLVLGVSLWRSSGYRQRLKIFLAGIILSIILITIITPVFPSKIGGMSWRTHEDLSSRLVGRKLIWMAAHDMVVDHPILGVGIGGFPYKYYDYQGAIVQSYPLNRILPAREVVLAAHNEILHVACESGLLGAFLMLVILCWPIIKLWKWSPEEDYDQRLRLTILASLFGIFPSMLVAFPVQVPATGPLIFFLFQFGVGRMSKEVKSSKMTWPVISVICAAGILATIVLVAQYISSRYLEKALITEESEVSFAEINYKKGIVWAPDKGIAKSIYGSFLVRTGKIDEGVCQLSDSLKTFQDAYTYENLGRAAQRNGNYEEAIEFFKQAQMAGINYYQDASDIAVIYAIQGKWEKAEKELTDILMYFPENRIIKNSLGKIRLSNGDYKGAIEVLSSIGKKSDAETWSLLGAALLSQNRWREAELSLGKALEYQPGRIDALNNMALIYLRTGRTLRSKALIDAVLKKDPDNESAQRNLQLLVIEDSKTASESSRPQIKD